MDEDFEFRDKDLSDADLEIEARLRPAAFLDFDGQQKIVDNLKIFVEAARLRFRPVCMTILAFVVGVFPLVIASGAGAASRTSLGLTIFGGALMAAIGGTILVPIFFTTR